MADDVRPEKIRKTQESLGKYIKKPPLTEKLLKKPPFRFLHDIVTAIMKDTGFLQGVFTPDELISDNIKDRDAKMAFLDKLITNIKAATGSTVTAKPSKIVAGMEVNKTLDLLLLLSKAVEVKMTGDRLAPSEKRKEAKATEGKSPRQRESKAGDKKSMDGKEKESGTKKTSSKDKHKEEKGKTEVPKKKKSEETPSEEKPKEKKADIKVNGEAEHGKRPSLENGEIETTKEVKQEISQPDDKRKSARTKDESRRKSSRRESQEILEEAKEVPKEDEPKINETTDAQPSSEQLQRRSSVHERHRRSSAVVDLASSSQDNMSLVNGDVQVSAKPERRRSTARRERSSVDRTESKDSTKENGEHVPGDKDAKEERKKSAAVEQPKDEPVPIAESQVENQSKTVASAKIKRPHSARMKPASSRQRKKIEENGKGISSDASSIDLSSGGKQGSIDNDSGIVGAPSPQSSIPSATSMRRSARPGSSRPGAPRARERGTVAVPEPTGPARPVQVIEDAAAATQDDDDMVIVDRSPAQIHDTDQLDSGIEVEAGKEGALVHQILESKRELEESKVMTQWGVQSKPTVNIEWEGGKKLRGQTWTTEVEKLREGIQSITKSSHPLGKLFDFLQEDVELMERELTMWKDTNRQLKTDLANHQRETNDSLAMLKKQLEDINVLIENEQEAIRRVKTNIVLNNAKIEQLLRVSSP